MKYILLVFSFITLLHPAHEVPIALFDITIVSDETITIDIQFDKEDLEKAIAVPTNENIEAYLSVNTQWQLNKKITPLEICSIQKDQEHYSIQTQFPPLSKKLEMIDIRNSCLIEIPNHSNIIYLHYDGKKRGFRLHKDRLQTSIEL